MATRKTRAESHAVNTTDTTSIAMLITTWTAGGDPRSIRTNMTIGEVNGNMDKMTLNVESGAMMIGVMRTMGTTSITRSGMPSCPTCCSSAAPAPMAA